MAADPGRYAMIQELIAMPKRWTSGADMRALWNQANQRRFPKPFFFKVTLEIDGEALEGLFVEVRYKQTHVPGNRDSLNMSLIIDGVRALGLDENGPSLHTNLVGKGLPYYRHVIDHPHWNFCVPEALDGYAEPALPGSSDHLWTLFTRRANIVDAPPFLLPIGQTELPL